MNSYYNLKNDYIKSRYSFKLDDLLIIDRISYVLIKHRDLSCPRNNLLSSLEKKRRGYQERGIFQYTNLKFEPYIGVNDDDRSQTLNTIKVSFATTPENITSEEYNKKLLAMTYQFLSKHKQTKPSLFTKKRNPYQTNVFNVDVNNSFETIENQLKKIDHEITQYNEEKNSLVMKVQELKQKMSHLKQQLNYPSITGLQEERELTEFELINAYKNVSDLQVQQFLEAELEKLRDILRAQYPDREISSHEVLAHFGMGFIKTHLHNAKEMFLANQSNYIHMLQLKIQWMSVAEAKEIGLHNLLHTLEIDYGNFSSHLKNVDQAILIRAEDRKKLLSQMGTTTEIQSESYKCGK